MALNTAMMSTKPEMDLTQPPFKSYPAWVIEKLSPLAVEKIQAVHDWVETECVPAEAIMKAQLAKNRWETPQLMKQLRQKAKARGLFHLFVQILPIHLIPHFLFLPGVCAPHPAHRQLAQT